MVIVLFCATVLLGETTGWSQESDTQLQSTSAIEASAERLRDLTCARAANFQYPHHDNATAIVVSRGYIDERFDAPVYSTLRGLTREDPLDTSRVRQALKLLPQSTLKEDVQIKLVFEAHGKITEVIAEFSAMRMGTPSAIRRLLAELTEFLKPHGGEVARLMKLALKDGVEGPGIFALVGVVDKGDIELADLIIEEIQSDDPDIADAAMTAAHVLIPKNRLAEDRDGKPSISDAPIRLVPKTD